jgi:hypothetical protein
MLHPLEVGTDVSDQERIRPFWVSLTDVLGLRFAQMEGKWPSLSSLDRRICSLFFYWSTWNVFLGAMLGGSAFSQLGIVLNNPSIIPNVIGTALPASSNFFISYVIIQVDAPVSCLHQLAC